MRSLTGSEFFRTATGGATLLILAAGAGGCSAASDTSPSFSEEPRVELARAPGSLTESLALGTSSGGVSALPSEPGWILQPNPFGWGMGDAFVMGHDVDGAALYACRASWAGGLHPGKTRRDETTCDIGYGGAAQEVSPYQVLGGAWTPAENGVIPTDAIPFGADAGGSPLYACRASLGGGVHIGKIGASFGACYVPWGGQEVHASSYSVLGSLAPIVPVSSWGTTITDSLAGGTDGDGATLYPCLAPFAGGVHIGKTRADWNACDVSYAGGEHWVSNYRLLMPELHDVPLQGTASAMHAYVAGQEAKSSSWFSPLRPLGLCATPFGASTQVGKYTSSNACNFAQNGVENVATSGFRAMASGAPIFSPVSVDFGLLALRDKRTTTITFVPQEDEDIAAYLPGPSVGLTLGNLTSWKANGSGSPVVDQQVSRGGTLHAAKGERVTVDLSYSPDFASGDLNQSVVVQSASWSFAVPFHARWTVVGNSPMIILGRDPDGVSDQEGHRGGSYAFQVTVTNIGQASTTFTLGASVDDSDVSIEPMAARNGAPVALGTQNTIQPGETQKWTVVADVSTTAAYTPNVQPPTPSKPAVITVAAPWSEGTPSLIETLSIKKANCAPGGSRPYDGQHEACCENTTTDGKMCFAVLPCASDGETPNTNGKGICCYGTKGSADGTCKTSPCGHGGEACCSTGHACNGNSDDDAHHLECLDSTCRSCGHLGEACCNLGGNLLSCPDGTPTDPIVCSPNTHVCVEASSSQASYCKSHPGGPGCPCNDGVHTSVTWCASGNVCNGMTCQPCGANGQACCAQSGVAGNEYCNDPMHQQCTALGCGPR